MKTMKIKLNEKEYEVNDGTSLTDFITGLGLQPQGIAVAIAYEVIPQTKWEETVLKDGMELMLIHAVSGG